MAEAQRRLRTARAAGSAGSPSADRGGPPRAAVAT
jgi:hypothetical protein